MANANSTLSPNAARLLTYTGSNCNCYQGTESQLVEAGIIKSEWLPGLHGNARTTTRAGLIDGEMRLLPFGVMATRYQRENEFIHICRASKSTFRVQVWKSEEEKDRETKREALRRNVEEMHEEKKRKLELAPKSREEFLKDKKSFIKPVLEHVLNHFRRHDGGFHYSSEVAEEARDLIFDLIALAENGKVYFDQKRHQYFMDDLEEKAEKVHPEFSAFMKATLAIGKAAL